MLKIRFILSVIGCVLLCGQVCSAEPSPAEQYWIIGQVAMQSDGQLLFHIDDPAWIKDGLSDWTIAATNADYANTLQGIRMLLNGLEPGQQKPLIATLGSAEMMQDGGLILYLLDLDGAQSMRVIRKNDKNYSNVLKHIGGIKPGEIKSLPAWPNSKEVGG